MITIVELGVGNTPSVQNMLEHVGARARLTRDPDAIRSASRLILPGVGSFDAGVRALRQGGLADALLDAVHAGTPLLGICLGMQLLGRSSEEGTQPGLGLVDATFRRFRDPPGGPPIKVPHIGWNRVTPAREHPLFAGFGGPGRFYFVHSFHADAVPPDQVLATTTYGGAFPSAVGRGNVAGVQFHPEKSHADGMRLLANFAGVAGGR